MAATACIPKPWVTTQQAYIGLNPPSDGIGDDRNLSSAQLCAQRVADGGGSFPRRCRSSAQMMDSTTSSGSRHTTRPWTAVVRLAFRQRRPTMFTTSSMTITVWSGYRRDVFTAETAYNLKDDARLRQQRVECQRSTARFSSAVSPSPRRTQCSISATSMRRGSSPTPSNPGDAYMLFDNYSAVALVAQSPMITVQPTSQTVVGWAAMWRSRWLRRAVSR